MGLPVLEEGNDKPGDRRIFERAWYSSFICSFVRSLIQGVPLGRSGESGTVGGARGSAGNEADQGALWS